MSGLFATLGKAPLDSKDGHALVRASLAMMRHRGRDGTNARVSGAAAIGAVRLATIGDAPQPVVREDLGTAAVLDGTVVNHRALRDELRSLGHDFHTDTDTEVVAVGYAQWGTDIAIRVRGGATFIIYDERERRLIVVRDRFGERQLFITATADRTLVATEAKALLPWPGVRREPDLASIHDYLTFRFSPGTSTSFKGIERVPPAHVTTIENDGRIAHQRYWSRSPSDPDLEISPEDACSQVISGLDEALGVIGDSDRPVGAFLSGGVDSTAIVARLTEVSGKPVRTFCAGFGVEDFDETDQAELHARRYGSIHTTHVLGEELMDTLDDLVWAYGEPFSDSSALVTTALSRIAGQEVRTILGGDGAEQTFLGAKRYMTTHILRERQAAGETVLIDVPMSTSAFGPPGARDFFLRSVSVFPEVQKRAAYGPALASYLLDPSADRLGYSLESCDPRLTAETGAALEMHGLLANNFLVKTDVAGAIGGAETRMPFIDHIFSDAMTKLPPSIRYRGSDGERELKGLLLHALEPHLPHETLYGKKSGFSVPVSAWLRTGRTNQLFNDTLRSRRFRERELIRPAYIDRILKEHETGTRNHITKLWSLLNLELWHITHVETVPTPRDLD